MKIAHRFYLIALLISICASSPAIAANYNQCSGVGDKNADSTREILCADPDAVVGTVLNAGSIALFSGVDGAKLWELQGSFKNGLLASSFAELEDLNQDGVKEIAVAEFIPRDRSTGRKARGIVKIYSGADRVLLTTLHGSAARVAIVSLGVVNGELLCNRRGEGRACLCI